MLTATESGKRDSNPRPQPWQGCALPTELFPQNCRVPHITSPAIHPTIRPNLANSTPSKRGVQRSISSRHGGEGNRTPDLLNAIQALSQLSYAPERSSRLSTGTTKYSRGYTRVSTNWDWRKIERPVFCSALRNSLRKGARCD